MYCIVKTVPLIRNIQSPASKSKKTVFMQVKPLFLFWALLFLLGGCGPGPWLYTSFHEPAKEGLRLIYSRDGYHWTGLNDIWLKPLVGDQKIMRDPSMVKGPDGCFHLVWTSAWKGNEGFGYAKSKDLIHWSDQQLIPVMESEPTTVNVWAPEITYLKDEKAYLIVWASTIAGRFPKGQEEEKNNHRLYYTLTKDFKKFSPAKLYFDPGYSSIDATLVKRSKKGYVLVFKDNTRPNRDIKVAFSKSPLGPFENVSTAVTPGLSEGPSVLKKGQDYLIYYDWYNHNKFGAVKTEDFMHFSSVTENIEVPKGHKHGTILEVSRHFLKKLIQEDAPNPINN